MLISIFVFFYLDFLNLLLLSVVCFEIYFLVYVIFRKRFRNQTLNVLNIGKWALSVAFRHGRKYKVWRQLCFPCFLASLSRYLILRRNLIKDVLDHDLTRWKYHRDIIFFNKTPKYPPSVRVSGLFFWASRSGILCGTGLILKQFRPELRPQKSCFSIFFWLFSTGIPVVPAYRTLGR